MCYFCNCIMICRDSVVYGIVGLLFFGFFLFIVMCSWWILISDVCNFGIVFY